MTTPEAHIGAGGRHAVGGEVVVKVEGLQKYFGRNHVLKGVDLTVYPQQTYVLLSAQLEDARLREAMDTPTVTLLDPAVPAERRAKPIRVLWAGAGMVLAGLASILATERRDLGAGRDPAATV